MKTVFNKTVLFSVVISVLLISCTLPIDIYLQNNSEQTVIVYAEIKNKLTLERLPNKVSFYRNDKEISWVKDTLVTWKNQRNFSLSIPAGMQIKLSQITDKLIFGLPSPEVAVKTDNEVIFTGQGNDFHKLYNSDRLKRLKRKTFLILLN